MERQAKRTIGRPKKADRELATKDKILFVATALFLDKGYPLVSMDDVAKHCNVTKATIYYYYKTKSELFTDAIIQLMSRIKQQLLRMLSTEEPLQLRLFHIAKAHMAATVDVDINAFMKEAKMALTPEQWQLLKQFEDDLYSTLEKALLIEMERGLIPKGNAKIQSVAFVALLTVGKSLVSERPLDIVTQEIIDLFWHGISA